MISFKNKKILIFGLKRSGEAVIRLFNKHGIKVNMTDENVMLKDLPHDIKENNYISYDDVFEILDQFDFLITSPGIPVHHPLIQQAYTIDLPILSEIEVGYQFLPPGSKLIAITGTNGKTTVTTLLTNVLNNQGIRATSCGNIGYPLSEAVLVDLHEVFVCECSSFQLDHIKYFRPDLAIWLNLAPHHLDHHGSFEAYQEAKFNLFKNMTYDDVAIINGDELEKIPLRELICHHYFFSVHDPSQQAYYDEDEGMIYISGKPFMKRDEMLLQGTENMMNVMAVILATKSLGGEDERLKETLSCFEPLKYRMEHIGNWAGVDFYNDSKSTNASAMLAAIRTLEQPILLIAGGKLKEDDYEKVFVHPNIKYVITFGENRKVLKAICDKVGKISFECLNLLEAMRLVKQMMQDGDAVLFSPGAQSYDQYNNYVERGEDFNQLFETVIQF